MKFHDAIKEIKERVSIVDVIGKYVTLKRSGSNYTGLCPFHNEKTPSFIVSESKKIYRCFGECNKGGNVYNFLQDYLNISFREAVLMLAKQVNIEIEDDDSRSESYKKNDELKKKLYQLHKDVANTYYKILFSDIGKPGLEYFKSRKLTNETILKFGLGYAPDKYGYVYNLMKEKGYDDEILFSSKLFRVINDKPCDTFYNRVMFPLVDTYKNVVGFQSRSLEPKPNERKYVNSEDSIIFHKRGFLYAMNYAYYSKENFYILCEGNMDAITIQQAGFDNAIATMGTAFNEKQMFLLKRKPKKVYLCQDTDEAGVNAIINSDKILRAAGIDTYVIDFSPAKDADEFINKYGASEFKKKLDAPIPTILFYVSTLKKKYNLSDPYEQEKYFNDIINELSQVSNTFVRDNLLKQIAINEQLDYGALNQLLINHLKGNSVKLDTNKPIFAKTENTKTKEGTTPEISNVDSIFIYLSFVNTDLKDKIKEVIDESELINEIYKYLYKLYLDGNTISDVYDEIVDKDEKEKSIINNILSSNYNYENSDKQVMVDALNQVIRQIKIRNLRSTLDNDLNKVYEANKKMLEINKSIYIK